MRSVSMSIPHFIAQGRAACSLVRLVDSSMLNDVERATSPERYVDDR